MIFHCARPTRAFLGRALREHRRSSGSIPSSVLRARRAPGHSLRALFFHSPGNGTRVGPTAPVERVLVPFLNLSLGERPRLSSTARMERALPNLMLLPSLLVFFSGRVACLISHCARPTRAFRGRALREHRRSTGHPPVPPHNAPNVRSKNCFVRVICCSMSACKSRAPAFQSSFV
jgi:hypothetical protein